MSQTQSTPETEDTWREFHERLRAFISRRVPRHADADDILQEVFIRIHRGARALQNRDRLPAWIFQVTRNVISDYYRGLNPHGGPPPADFDSLAEVGAHDQLELKELSGCVQPMIAALPEHYREAMELTEIKGLTQIEAAELRGISLSGMKSRVQRARRRLKDMLLECCRIELDRRGGIVDFAVRDVNKSPCGPCARKN